MMNDQENLGKFDFKSDEEVFLKYSVNNKSYRMFNLRTHTALKSINVVDGIYDFAIDSKEEEIISLS